MSLESFINGYTEALLWSSSGTAADGTEYESLESHALAPEALERISADCRAFYDAHQRTWFDQHNRPELAPHAEDAYAGHDFWLTRAGHGAGFWDGDWSDVGDILTDACKAYPNLDPYIGDDGLVYLG